MDDLEKAYSYAIYLLSLKLRTEGEIRNKLKIKNFKFQIIERVISRLKGNNYLDDDRYTEIYLDNLKKYKTFGYYGIKKKLMEKRLPSAVIENALSEGLSEEEEVKIAKRFLRNLYLESLSYKEKQKISQKMKGKGFRAAVISLLVF